LGDRLSWAKTARPRPRNNAHGASLPRRLVMVLVLLVLVLL
jgi:hypothetical protein